MRILKTEIAALRNDEGGYRPIPEMHEYSGRGHWLLIPTAGQPRFATGWSLINRSVGGRCMSGAPQIAVLSMMTRL